MDEITASRIVNEQRDMVRGDDEKDPFCDPLTSYGNLLIEDVRERTGIQLPTCDEVLTKYVQEKMYMDAIQEEPIDRKLGTLGKYVYPMMISTIADLMLNGKSLFRSYDFEGTFGVNVSEKERIERVRTIKRHARDGCIESFAPTEWGSAGIEAGETSWGSDPEYYENSSWLYFEAKSPHLDAINIPASFFINNLFMGGEAGGFEFKVKNGAKMNVTLHHEKKPGKVTKSGRFKRGEMMVDPIVKNKIVQFGNCKERKNDVKRGKKEMQTVDIYKYRKRYTRDEDDEPIPWKSMSKDDFEMACRFPQDVLRTMFRGGNDAMYADAVIASRNEAMKQFKDDHCKKGTKRLREPDFVCFHSGITGKPTCQMKEKMSGEARYETGATHSWSPSHYWGKDKLVPDEWKQGDK